MNRKEVKLFMSKNNQEIVGCVSDYLTELKKTIDALPMDRISSIITILQDAYRNNKKVFICGNGGSASTASHMVNDLAKGTIVKDKKRFRAISLCDNLPLMTAWANDDGYENMYVEQLQNLLENGDILIAISGSGNSPNILKAIEYANNHNATTIGLTGFQGGKLKSMVKECLVVPSNSMQRIEDIHLVMGHLLMCYFKEAIQKDSNS